jgi:hypothetical protein
MPGSIKNFRLRIGIFTEGPLAMLGHDRVFDQPATLKSEWAAGGLDGTKISAQGDLRRAEILGKISERDRAAILEKKDKEVFHTDVFPVFSYEGTYRQAEGMIVGALTLHGATHACNLPVRVQPGISGGGKFVEGGLELDLRPFGIKPFKALLGQLRVKPSVHVSYSAEIEPTQL